MGKFIDLSGQRFGRLTVTSIADKSGVATRFICKCDCGKETVCFSNNLRRGLVSSCGCFRGEMTAARNTTHGLSGTTTYEIWSGIIKRCTNPSDRNFKRYGGRGISVCDRWLKFENFLSDMGERPVGASIDRRDNSGNYCLDNCRWASKVTQANNTRTNRYITLRGVTKTLAEWAIETGYNRKLISDRIDRGWSVEDALQTPPIHKFMNHSSPRPQ